MKIPFKKKSKKDIKKEDINLIDIESTSDKYDSTILKTVNDLKDNIAPDGFSVFDTLGEGDYIKLGDKYCACLVITGYPDSASVGWLERLYDICTDVSIHYYQVPKDEASRELTYVRTKFKAKLSKDMEEGYEGAMEYLSSLVNDVSTLKQRIIDEVDDLFYITVTATLLEDSLEELDKRVAFLKEIMRGKGVDIRRLTYRQHDIFTSAVPICKNNVDDLRRPIDLGGMVATFPFYDMELFHESGIPIGVNLGGGRHNTPAFFDAFHENFNNYNIFICGESGGGKSVTTKTLITRSALLGKINSVNIDFKGEYSKVTEFLGGLNILINPTSNQRINPLDVEFDNILKKVDILTKITEVRSLIVYLVENSAKGQKVSGTQMSKLTEVITEVYMKDFNINDTEESLYEIPENGLYGGPIKKKMPTISDIYNKLLKYGENDEEIMEIAVILRMYTRGHSDGFFDGQTNVEFDNYPLVNFDISTLEEQFARPFAQYVLMNFLWEKFVKTNILVKKRISIDEAHMALKHPNSLDFIDKMVRMGRSYNLGMCIISQDFETIYKTCKSILDNSTTKIFLRQNATIIDEFKRVFKLSEGVCSFLTTSKKGHAVFQINNEIFPVYIDLTDYEAMLFETNPNLIKKYEEEGAMENA